MGELLHRIMVTVRRLLTETDTTLGEFVCSTTLITTGVWLLIRFRPDTFEAVPVYSAMKKFLPEWAWGALALGFGLLQGAANLKRSRQSRQTAAAAGCAFLSFISLFTFYAIPASLLVPFAGTIAFCEGVIFLLLRRPVREREHGLA